MEEPTPFSTVCPTLVVLAIAAAASPVDAAVDAGEADVPRAWAILGIAAIVTGFAALWRLRRVRTRFQHLRNELESRLEKKAIEFDALSDELRREQLAGERAAVERDRLSIQLLYAHKLEAIGMLASGVAHDFNNALTAILSYTEILESHLRNSAGAKHSLAGIRNVSGQASALSKTLLAFTSDASPEKSTLDLTTVAKSTVKWLRRIVPAAVELEAKFPRDPVWANVDAIRFQQVIVGLVITARDAAPEGGTIQILLDQAPPSRPQGHNGSRHGTAILSGV